MDVSLRFGYTHEGKECNRVANSRMKKITPFLNSISLIPLPADQDDDTSGKYVKQQKSRTLHQKRQHQIRDRAVELVHSGRIQVCANDVHTDVISTDLTIPCPFCGEKIPETADPIYQFAKAWIDTPENERLGVLSPMVIRYSRNPFSKFTCTPFWSSDCTCAACGQTSTVTIQLVIG
jgi:hypothetical protein